MGNSDSTPSPSPASSSAQGEVMEDGAALLDLSKYRRAYTAYQAQTLMQSFAGVEGNEVNLLTADPLAKYRRAYTEDQIAANKAKVAPEGTGEAMYAAAEKGDAAELLKLVEPWFAHPVLNDYSGGNGDWTPLIGASRNGHIECVRVLVAQPGIELNKGHRDYQSSALYWSSCKGHVDIVELLCSLPGIDCNKADINGHTPHSIACVGYSGSDKEERTRKIRAILEAKAEAAAELKLLAADPLYKYRRSYTEAQIAANRAKVAPEGTGEAMYAAADNGDAAELLKLVEPWFAHPVLNDYSGGPGGNETPLQAASRIGNIECVRVLVAQPGIELNKGHRNHQLTALLYASWKGHVDIVELLCSLPGIDCNKADINGATPHSRACFGYSGSDKEERTRKIRAILEAKADRHNGVQCLRRTQTHNSIKAPFLSALRHALLDDKESSKTNVQELLDILSTALDLSQDQDAVSEEALEFILGEVKSAPGASLLQVLEAVKLYIFDMAYLEALKGNSRPLRRSRLMIVGEGAAGKTSFVRALTSQAFINEHLSTVGLNIQSFKTQDDENSTLHDAGFGVSQYVAGAKEWVKMEGGVSEAQRTLDAEVGRLAFKGKKRTIRERMALLRALPEEEGNKDKAPRPQQHDALQRLPAANASSPSTGPKDTTAEARSVDEEKEGRLKLGETARDGLTSAGSDPKPAALTATADVPTSRETKVVLDEDEGRSLGSHVLVGTHEVDALSFSVWDFGGQRVFQNLQHLFLSRYGVYVLAFDLQRVSVSLSSAKTIENSLSYIRFWFRQMGMTACGAPLILLGTHMDALEERGNALAAAAAAAEGSDSPHPFSLASELQDISSRLVRAFDKQPVWGYLAHNADESLCFFPVVNNLHDGNIVKLRGLIDDLAKTDSVRSDTESHDRDISSGSRTPVAVDEAQENKPYVDFPTPVPWLRVCDKLRELEQKRGVSYLIRRAAQSDADKGATAAASTASEELRIERGGHDAPLTVFGVAEACGVFAHLSDEASESERMTVLNAMLRRFNKLGILVHIDETGMDDVVILNPQWLIDMVVCVIRDFSLHPLRRDRRLMLEQREAWYDLTYRGVLSSRLLDTLWVEQADKTVFLTSFFEKMLIMTRLPPSLDDTPGEAVSESAGAESGSGNESGKVRLSYLVPSVFMVSDDEVATTQSTLDSAQDFCATIRVSFPDFLPDGYLGRLTVRLASYCSERVPIFEEGLQMPCLFHHHGVLCCAVQIAGASAVLRHDSSTIFVHICHTTEIINGPAIQAVLDESLRYLQQTFYRSVPFNVDYPLEYPSHSAALGAGLRAARAALSVSSSNQNLLDRFDPLELAAVPKLTRSGYYTWPPLKELRRLPASELMKLSSFVVGHHEYGEVHWLQKVNVVGLDLDAIVRMEPGSVEVYPDDFQGKPDVGSGLNNMALITLKNVWGTSEEVLRAHCEQQSGGEMVFERYDRVRGMFSFSVAHFTVYAWLTGKALPPKPQQTELSEIEQEEEDKKKSCVRQFTKWLRVSFENLGRHPRERCAVMAELLYVDGHYTDVHPYIADFFAQKNSKQIWLNGSVSGGGKIFTRTDVAEDILSVIASDAREWGKIVLGLAEIMKKGGGDCDEGIQNYLKRVTADAEGDPNDPPGESLLDLWFQKPSLKVLKSNFLMAATKLIERQREEALRAEADRARHNESLDAVLLEYMNRFEKRFGQIDASLARIETKVELIPQHIQNAQSVLLKGMLDVDDVSVPSCFVVLNYRLPVPSSEDDDEQVESNRAESKEVKEEEEEEEEKGARGDGEGSGKRRSCKKEDKDSAAGSGDAPQGQAAKLNERRAALNLKMLTFYSTVSSGAMALVKRGSEGVGYVAKKGKEAIEAVKNVKVNDHRTVGDLLDNPISFCYDREAYFYLVDELTMTPLVPSQREIDDGCPFPLVITRPCAFIRKHIGLIMTSWSAVLMANGLVNLAKNVFPYLPTIPDEYREQASAFLEQLDQKSSVEQFNTLQRCVSEASNQSLDQQESSSEAKGGGVRGQPLRELISFFTEQNDALRKASKKSKPVMDFCGMERVLLSQPQRVEGKEATLSAGTCIWTTGKSKRALNL